jgi:hypothetical protein
MQEIVNILINLNSDMKVLDMEDMEDIQAVKKVQRVKDKVMLFIQYQIIQQYQRGFHCWQNHKHFIRDHHQNDYRRFITIYILHNNLI